LKKQTLEPELSSYTKKEIQTNSKTTDQSLFLTHFIIFVAAILQRRISRTLDRHLQKTQYGFRKDRSTPDAIHLIRRVIEYGESTNNKLHLLLLDWEKAFDKVDREEMFNAMERTEIIPKLTSLVKTIYKNTKFKVEIDGRASDWQTHSTGIKQGCPLSPYLFLIVMTTMFYDVHQETDKYLAKWSCPSCPQQVFRPPGWVGGRGRGGQTNCTGPPRWVGG